MNELCWVTGGCCQWRGSASYDRVVRIACFVHFRKYSDKIATEQQPPAVTNQL